MFDDIKKFNTMYGFPCPDKPTLPDGFPLKLLNFTKILRDELDEGFDIIETYNKEGSTNLETLTNLADWFSDIMIYCASEGTKYGLPMQQVIDIIMQSNFSKMGADGNPIKDQFGKLQKGPNYWKPEPKISQLLSEKLNDNT
jgi:predicted HAD superfamily Cof-like phosphohydrolase